MSKLATSRKDGGSGQMNLFVCLFFLHGSNCFIAVYTDTAIYAVPPEIVGGSVVNVLSETC